jgi:WD40 repeat protein
VTVAAPPRPYKGLMPFEDAELDALLFFGREREREIIVANLLASRLTVLYGPSGVGKTSLLRAGVAQQLRSLPDAEVAVFSSWAEDPTDRIDEVIASAAEVDLYLILDQIEEYFLYHGADAAFARRLPEIVREAARVNVLLGVREDALAKLDFFKGRIPNLFSNYLRLDHLDRPAARLGIIGPLQRLNELWPGPEPYGAERELVEAVLDQVATGRIEYGLSGRGIVKGRDEPPRIEAPFLQLVLERLWDSEEEAGSHGLRLETLERLGGAETIVREHLERALASLDPRQQELAAEIFDHLVTPSGTKIAHGVSDLAGYASVSPDELDDVLARLSHERIVRRVDDAAADGRFEIFHDVLAGGVVAWRSGFEAERELKRERTRRRRAVAIASAALLALTAVAAVALFALAQRSRAEEEARNARARELSARALAALDEDPQRALRLAVAAARQEPTLRAEDLLRRVLLEARQRAVFPALPASALVAFTGNDSVVVPGEEQVQTYTATGRLLEPLPLRSASLVALSPDERLALSVEGLDAVLRETRTGEPLARLRHTGPIRTGAFDPRGRFVATVAQNRKGREHVRLFRVDGRLVRVFAPRGMKSVAFSRDGRYLAAGSADKTARVWRVRDGRLIRTLAPHNDDVVALSFDPRGEFVATGSNDGGVRVWEVSSGARTFFFPGHTNPVVAVDWTEDGTFLADASLDRSARIWQVAGAEEGTLRARLVGHEAGVRAVAFSPDGDRIATAASDGTARVWDARAEQQLDEVQAPLGGTGRTAASFLNRGRWIVSTSARCADVTTLRGSSVYKSCRDAIAVARADRAGTRLVIGDAKGASVERVPDGATTRLPHRGAVNDALFLADGRIATASVDGWLRVFDRRGRMRSHLDYAEPLSRLAARSDGLLATASVSGLISIWRPTRQALTLSGHDGAISALSFAPDGSTVLSAGQDGVVRVWDATSGALRHELRGHALGATAATFSPDGRRIATASADKQVRVWDARTGLLLHELVGHFAAVNSVAFSPDGRWLVSTSALAAALWSTRTGRLFAYLRGHTKPVVRSAEFSPDGRSVLTAGDDGTVRIYDCEVCGRLDELIALAERRLAAAKPAR